METCFLSKIWQRTFNLHHWTAVLPERRRKSAVINTADKKKWLQLLTEKILKTSLQMVEATQLFLFLLLWGLLVMLKQLFLFAVHDLCMFCLLMWPIPPTADKTMLRVAELFPSKTVDGNAPNSHFFFLPYLIKKLTSNSLDN